MDEGVYPASWSKKMTHWLSQVENSDRHFPSNFVL
jgi:hypothetical protein